MAESLASRVGRIISGSVNALISAVENSTPELVLEEAIREVESALDDVRSELGREIAKKHLASNRLMEENREHEELSAKIELAIREGRDDLAEAAAAKQLDIEAKIPVLERALSECGDHEKELESYVGALRAKKREMTEELDSFRKRNATAETTRDGEKATSTASATSSVGDRVERATSAFDRVLEASTGVPTASGNLGTETQLAELEELARKNRIRERVAAARAKLEKE